MDSPAEAGPLTGVTVLELSHYIAGPYAAQILADQGAEVIKVEPRDGEPSRRSLPLAPDGESLYYAAYNRGKRSVALDLRNPAASPVLDRLLRRADIVLTNYSAGVPERLGFGYDRLATVNPAAILVHITGFGTWSDQSDFAAFDSIMQAVSGFASLTGSPDGPPYVSNALVGDHVTAAHAALAASSALHLRNRTGRGTRVEVSMMRALASLLGTFVPQSTVLGQSPHRSGNRSANRFTAMFPSSDGFVMVSALSPAMWKSFCEVIGHPEWGAERVARERLHTFDPELKVQVEAAVTEWTTRRTSAGIVAALQEVGVPCGAVRSVDEVVHDNAALNLRLFSDVALAGGGAATVTGPTLEWPGADSGGTRRIPALGAHDAEILTELGYTGPEIAALRDADVLAGPTQPQEERT